MMSNTAPWRVPNGATGWEVHGVKLGIQEYGIQEYTRVDQYFASNGPDTGPAFWKAASVPLPHSDKGMYVEISSNRPVTYYTELKAKLKQHVTTLGMFEARLLDPTNRVGPVRPGTCWLVNLRTLASRDSVGMSDCLDTHTKLLKIRSLLYGRYYGYTSNLG